MPREVQAWHFVGETLRDGRPVPPRKENWTIAACILAGGLLERIV